MIAERDRREALAASCQNDTRILAELQQRANMTPINVAEAKIIAEGN